VIEGEESDDWRAHVGEPDDPRSRDLARSRELGRGREATTPEQIPPRGWKDILWRGLWSISENRILSTSGGVAFFALLAVFPGIAAIVSLYGLFAMPLPRFISMRTTSGRSSGNCFTALSPVERMAAI